MAYKGAGGHKQHKEGKGVLGMRLKAERIRRNLRLVDMVEETGIHIASLTGFENRGVIPELHNLIKLAVALHCSIDWLVGLED